MHIIKMAKATVPLGLLLAACSGPANELEANESEGPQVVEAVDSPKAVEAADGAEAVESAEDALTGQSVTCGPVSILYKGNSIGYYLGSSRVVAKITDKARKITCTGIGQDFFDVARVDYVWKYNPPKELPEERGDTLVITVGGISKRSFTCPQTYQATPCCTKPLFAAANPPDWPQNPIKATAYVDVTASSTDLDGSTLLHFNCRYTVHRDTATIVKPRPSNVLRARGDGFDTRAELSGKDLQNACGSICNEECTRNVPTQGGDIPGCISGCVARCVK